LIEFTSGLKKQKARNRALEQKFKERVAQMQAATNKKIAAFRLAGRGRL
jgi:hypothetical protein